MELELVIVQFEEVKRLIKFCRVPQLRLAFILLDSAVELIMYRAIRSELASEELQVRMLENYRIFEAMGRGTDATRKAMRELENETTSKARRKKVDRDFSQKVDFMIEREKLPTELGPVLKRLHEYRNETYHRDQHRLAVMQPAVVIYFDVACTVLSGHPWPNIGESEELAPELARYQGNPPAWQDYDLPARAATELRKDVGLDLAVVRAALRSHLLERLQGLEEDIDYVEGFIGARHQWADCACFKEAKVIRRLFRSVA